MTVDRVRLVAGNASAMMWAVAALALLAAGGEVWRYVLMVRSLDGAVSSRLVATSDAVVTTAAVLALAFAVLAVVVVVWWLLLARRVAADIVHRTPARPDWQVLVYLAVPGVNLVMAGVVLAELEHQVLRRPAGGRPRPSRATVVWWAAWVVSGLLFGATVVWRFRGGAQAQADGIVLTAVTDLAAVAVAVLTALAVRRLTALLSPMDPDRVRHLRVVSVSGAPEPALRATRTVPSRR